MVPLEQYLMFGVELLPKRVAIGADGVGTGDDNFIDESKWCVKYETWWYGTEEDEMFSELETETGGGSTE